jgi:Holliday junction resolvasome RuvABC endonuclease subunit
MSLVGIDPSLTHCGWVVFDENKTGREAVQEIGVFQTEKSDGILIQRLLMQKERLRLLLSSRNIKFVAMEAPLMKDWSTELLFALHQNFHEVFLDLGIYLVYLQPSTIKKYAYPNMDPDDITKPLMTHLAKKELNRMGKRFSEHAADAYFAGKIGLKYYQWLFMKKFTDEQLSERERHMFCGKHLFTRGNKKGLTEYTGIIYRENEQFFDFSKFTRKSETIAKETTDGGKDFLHFRIL